MSIFRWKFACAGPPDVRTIVQRIFEQYPDPPDLPPFGGPLASLNEIMI